MKDRFRQIIENADNLPAATGTRLTPKEVVSASEQCEALAVEMMEKFLEWTHDKDLNRRSGKWFIREIPKAYKPKELIAKFLSENK